MGDLTKELIEAYVDTGEPLYEILQTEFQEGTKVFMGDLTKGVIEAYVDTGEPMCIDKVYKCSWEISLQRLQKLMRRTHDLKRGFRSLF